MVPTSCLINASFISVKYYSYRSIHRGRIGFVLPSSIGDELFAADSKLNLSTLFYQQKTLTSCFRFRFRFSVQRAPIATPSATSTPSQSPLTPSPIPIPVPISIRHGNCTKERKKELNNSQLMCMRV
jgi:hypothetical protein